MWISKQNPIINFVHGGTGCSEIPFVRKYQGLLEKNFTIVHYDQRASGKSYHFFEDYSNLNTDLHVEDLLELTDEVTKRINQKKVIIIGHSFGTYIGLKVAKKAQYKFSAYFGIGQVANPLQSEIDSLEYKLHQAKLQNNRNDVEKLEMLRRSIEDGKELHQEV